MNRIPILVIALLAAITWLLTTPEPAECVFCGNTLCFDSKGCFDGCTCKKDINDSTGVCVEAE